MYATDVVRRQTASLLNAPPRGGGITMNANYPEFQIPAQPCPAVELALAATLNEITHFSASCYTLFNFFFKLIKLVALATALRL